MQLYCVKQGERVVIPRVWKAESFSERALGLIGRSRLPDDTALYLPGSRAVHTWFMRFALDLWFLDRSGRVVRTVYGLAPWRMAWGGRSVTGVLETAAGSCRDLLDTGRTLALYAIPGSGTGVRAAVAGRKTN